MFSGLIGEGLPIQIHDIYGPHVSGPLLFLNCSVTKHF